MKIIGTKIVDAKTLETKATESSEASAPAKTKADAEIKDTLAPAAAPNVRPLGTSRPELALDEAKLKPDADSSKKALDDAAAQILARFGASDPLAGIARPNGAAGLPMVGPSNPNDISGFLTAPSGEGKIDPGAKQSRIGQAADGASGGGNLGDMLKSAADTVKGGGVMVGGSFDITGKGVTFSDVKVSVGVIRETKTDDGEKSTVFNGAGVDSNGNVSGTSSDGKPLKDQPKSGQTVAQITQAIVDAAKKANAGDQKTDEKKTDEKKPADAPTKDNVGSGDDDDEGDSKDDGTTRPVNPNDDTTTGTGPITAADIDTKKPGNVDPAEPENKSVRQLMLEDPPAINSSKTGAAISHTVREDERPPITGPFGEGSSSRPPNQGEKNPHTGDLP